MLFHLKQILITFFLGALIFLQLCITGSCKKKNASSGKNDTVVIPPEVTDSLDPKIADDYAAYGPNGKCGIMWRKSKDLVHWTFLGIVITCFAADNYNAIDPAVIVDHENGKHWMTYGSYFAGIFIVELDPLTGKILHDGDKGKLVAFRSNYHAGWQGFGHCGLLRDSTNYYYVSQARLGSNKYLMDLHIHRMVWSSIGWPTISPERYVIVPQTTITSTSLVGKWEHIDLVNTAYFNESITIDLAANGMISGVTNSDWQFQDGNLTLCFNNGAKIYYCKVFNEWDWELKQRTLAYSGMTREGISEWGKKVN